MSMVKDTWAAYISNGAKMRNVQNDESAEITKDKNAEII